MRCFIAIELPERVKSVLTGIEEELKKSKADVRWVEPNNIHLTLKFLGNVKEERIQKIIDAMERVCSSYNSFNLEVRGVGMFPNSKSPRVLWVGIENNSILTALQAGIEKEMAKMGFKPEERGFKAHLTLGRFKSSTGKESLFDAIKLHEKDSVGAIDVRSISLIRSDLHPTGARYSKIVEVALGEAMYKK